MAYITALLLIDAPASALNNSGDSIPNARTDNTSSVKFIRKYGGGLYPYATAQAYRRWLRTSIERDPQGWAASPVYREEKVAYVDANPLRYWDDDLLGYMRAPGKKKQEKAGLEQLTPMGDDVSALTRISPLRVSTFVAVSPVYITNDFGVMARQEGDPAPFEHQFYRATLQGLLSLDMGSAGVFTYSQRTGYQNLDSIRCREAEQAGLEHRESDRAYRLSADERLRRIRRLVEAIPLVQGGAKQTLHYTDVSPVVSIAAVFCASFKRCAMRWRRRDMRTRSSRGSAGRGGSGPFAAGAIGAKEAGAGFASKATSTSPLVTRPPRPLPSMAAPTRPFSSSRMPSSRISRWVREPGCSRQV